MFFHIHSKIILIKVDSIILLWSLGFFLRIHEFFSCLQNQLTKSVDAKPLDQDLTFIVHYSPRHGIKVLSLLLYV